MTEKLHGMQKLSTESLFKAMEAQNSIAELTGELQAVQVQIL